MLSGIVISPDAIVEHHGNFLGRIIDFMRKPRSSALGDVPIVALLKKVTMQP